MTSEGSRPQRRRGAAWSDGPGAAVVLGYGREGLPLRLPEAVDVLRGQDIPALPAPLAAVEEALARPIGCAPLAALLRERAPRTVAIAVSDSTRPVPNRDLLPPLLACLQASGVPASGVVIVIGTGMHRPSTPAERLQMLGAEILDRVEVIDHRADAAETLACVSASPPIRVCRRFVEADFRIVTGLIEPHFMAGFSGGRKGVCPALVDLATVQRFHGFETLADPRAGNGVLAGNPCHELALAVARRVGVDFIVNAAISRDQRLAGVFAGDLELAHEAGCRRVGGWSEVRLDHDYDLVIGSGGGEPLDRTFYQAVKGMCAALPAVRPDGLLLVASRCAEGLGSPAYCDLLLTYGRDWRRFLREAAARRHETRLDQWELQMQTRVLERIGPERLLLASDGIPAELVLRLAATPVPGVGTAAERTQAFLERFLASRPHARVAVMPEGPYSLLLR
ncbi:MAG: nickel-dependent lactate racemase [Lentisphaerae bacterium]|nr:nickel-dependent lactate racemase [Lentisphaerota bacterium]